MSMTEARQLIKRVERKKERTLWYKSASAKKKKRLLVDCQQVGSAVVPWLVRCTDDQVEFVSLGSTPRREQGTVSVLQVNTCADSSSHVSLSCAQHAPRSLRTLKIPRPPFHRRGPNG